MVGWDKRLQLIKNADQDRLLFPQAEISSQIRELIIFALSQAVEENGLDLYIAETPDLSLIHI